MNDFSTPFKQDYTVNSDKNSTKKKKKKINRRYEESYSDFETIQSDEEQHTTEDLTSIN